MAMKIEYHEAFHAHIYDTLIIQTKHGRGKCNQNQIRTYDNHELITLDSS
jgi:hypothetical protein